MPAATMAVAEVCIQDVDQVVRVRGIPRQRAETSSTTTRERGARGLGPPGESLDFIRRLPSPNASATISLTNRTRSAPAVGNLTAAHDQNAVAEADEFLNFRRDHQNARASVRQSVNQWRPQSAPTIDASGRFVEESARWILARSHLPRTTSSGCRPLSVRTGWASLAPGVEGGRPRAWCGPLRASAPVDEVEGPPAVVAE